MKTKSSLVRSYSGIELYTVADIDMVLSLIIRPWYTEADDSFRFYETLKEGILTINFFVLLNNRRKGLQDSLCRLQKLRLSRMLLTQFLIYFIYIRHRLASVSFLKELHS